MIVRLSHTERSKVGVGTIRSNLEKEPERCALVAEFLQCMVYLDITSEQEKSVQGRYSRVSNAN